MELAHLAKQFAALSHPDLHFSYPVAKTAKVSSTKKVDAADYQREWLELLKNEEHFSLYNWFGKLGIENKQALINVHEVARVQKHLNLKSYSGGYKFLILWHPERMRGDAQNKFLKTLEEPPAKTILILVSENPDLLLPTITSRCQKIFVPKLTKESVAEYLQNEEGILAQNAKAAAELSEGNLAKAKQLARQSETYQEYAALFRDWVRGCFKKDIDFILNWSEKTARFDREKLRNFLAFSGNTFSQSLGIHYKENSTASPLFSQAGFDLEKFAPFVKVENAHSIHSEIQNAARNIQRNANGKIVLTDLSFKMIPLLIPRKTE